MKNLKRSARTLNTILNIVFWLLIARGIYAAGIHALTLHKLFTNPTTLSGHMDRLTVDWLTIEAANGFGVDFDGAVAMKLVQLIFAAAITVIACLGIQALKRVLLPIELGQPFRSGISADVLALGRCAFRLGMVENLYMLAVVILMERHSILRSALLSQTITSVSADPAFRPAWFIVTAVLTILAMVFRRGEELQQLSDETL